ncbi:DUF742 domain-containing protein [Actinomadura sp. 7K534]|uniref:DUF742 domain-containing protein n=1 Tax=Actinomadura sp. 7K534 TaxID=2530366 RepID=UPI0010522960|nr:DUF742 domain-containing protein [Actinomadura sp. 7K534]TDB91856.1 DUF742 domain-containing protein [Actinomadura sp. 7K534]
MAADDMAASAGWSPRQPPARSAGDPARSSGGDQAWVTYEAEELSLYAITGGRTRPQHSMRLVTLLEVADPASAKGMAPEAVKAVELCRAGPCSVAEIAARIGLPIQATKIVLSDLIDSGALVMALPGPEASDHLQLLEALRSGLETRLSDVA